MTFKLVASSISKEQQLSILLAAFPGRTKEHHRLLSLTLTPKLTSSIEIDKRNSEVS
jgi:hypothetical protein